MPLRTLLALLLTLALAAPAGAIVTYDADAMSTFTLVSTGGMGVTFEISPEPTPTATTGTGIASIDEDSHTPPATFAPVPGESVTILSEVSGSADAPAGTSFANVFNGMVVVLDNTASTSAAVAEFEFSYSWLAEITKTDPANEAATAAPFFHLTGFAPSGGETLAIDSGSGPGPEPEWLVHPLLISPFGAGDLSDTGSETVTALVTVPAGSIDSFSVITDSIGSALTPATPEPSTGLLVLAGVVSWAIGRRRGGKPRLT